MIEASYVATMAAYNHWQNQNLYRAAEGLSDVERRRERGAFFGSIHGTLNHILWADQIWMHRLAGKPLTSKAGVRSSPDLHPDWAALRWARDNMDQSIIDWAQGLEPDSLEGDLSWHSNAVGREVTRPRGLLVTHMFNHQTHHRGQVHAMLTAAGAHPSDTDLAFMGDLAMAR